MSKRLAKDSDHGGFIDANVNWKWQAVYSLIGVATHRYVAVLIQWLFSSSKIGSCVKKKKSEEADACTNLGVAE